MSINWQISPLHISSSQHFGTFARDYKEQRAIQIEKQIKPLSSYPPFYWSIGIALVFVVSIMTAGVLFYW